MKFLNAFSQLIDLLGWKGK